MKRYFLKDSYIMVAIAINCIVIFLLHFPQIATDYPDLFFFLEIIDYIFIIVFLLEAIIKIKVYGAKQYFGNNWDRFDFVIVLLTLPSLLAFLPLYAGMNTSLIKVLRLGRLGRLVRLLRFMSFIPRMELIMAGVKRAIKASVFVMIALIILNFILALFTCHFYGESNPEYFGDPAISSYYIFQLFTVEGWNEIPQDVINSGGAQTTSLYAGLTRFYFIIVVLSGGIFGMSLANAIFIDEMTMDNNRDVEQKLEDLEKQIQEIKELLQKQ